MAAGTSAGRRQTKKVFWDSLTTVNPESSKLHIAAVTVALTFQIRGRTLLLHWEGAATTAPRVVWLRQTKRVPLSITFYS